MAQVARMLWKCCGVTPIYSLVGFLEFHPYMHLFSFRKTLCDLFLSLFSLLLRNGKRDTHFMLTIIMFTKKILASFWSHCWRTSCTRAVWVPSYQYGATCCIGGIWRFRHNTKAALSTLQDHLQWNCHFNQETFTVSTSLIVTMHHIPHNLVLNYPFARTNSYFYSFVPQSISY